MNGKLFEKNESRDAAIDAAYVEILSYGDYQTMPWHRLKEICLSNGLSEDYFQTNIYNIGLAVRTRLEESEIMAAEENRGGITRLPTSIALVRLEAYNSRKVYRQNNRFIRRASQANLSRLSDHERRRTVTAMQLAKQHRLESGRAYRSLVKTETLPRRGVAR